MKTVLFNQTVADKYLSRVVYQKGNEYSFEDARAEELVAAGVGKIVDKIIEKEAIVINEKDIIKNVKAEETIEVVAPEVIIETAEADKTNVEVAMPKRKRTTKANK